MRSILITVMLLLTVVVLYTATIVGPGGMKQSLRQGAEQSRGKIESINP